jgi:uncharacterized peroxidase-related enzyme
MSNRRATRFTLDFLDWEPWLETVDEVDATPEQLAVVDEIMKGKKGRAYWATLAHDVAALRGRMPLYTAILQGEGGGPRSDRELAATAGSRVTGCVYCASVHARAYVQQVRSREMIQRLLDEGIETDLAPRERAIVDFAAKLSTTPDQVGTGDLAPLTNAGLSDVEILDVAQATAIFANANRLMLTLGQRNHPDGES